MLLDTLGASLLTGRGLFRAGKGMNRAGNQGQGIKTNSVKYWVVFFVKEDEVIYFDSFGVEYIPKEIMEKIEHSSLGNKNIKTLEFKIKIQ